MTARAQRADRVIRWTTTLSVVVLAVIAAGVSYRHMYELVLRYGETSWTAALLPISVDGMIAASSMSLLADSRQGRRGGLLPWALLVVGSAASLAANVAVAEPSAVGRLIAAWPSFALIGSYELLMRQIRYAAVLESSDAPLALTDGSPEAGITRELAELNGERAERRNADSDESLTLSGEPLRHRAWRWALDQRVTTGKLPSGEALAAAFDRKERWGRLVKQAGLAGELGSARQR